MQMLRQILHRLKSLRPSVSTRFRGFMTIMAFTDTGWMRQFRLSKRIIFLSCIVLIALAFAATLTLLNLVRGQYYLTRMQYLERENRAMTSVLAGQAEQLSKFKLEMVRLKEFEESLRQVSGLSVRSEPQEKESDPAEGGFTSLRRRP